MSQSQNFWILALFVVLLLVVGFGFLWMVVLRNALTAQNGEHVFQRAWTKLLRRSSDTAVGRR